MNGSSHKEVSRSEDNDEDSVPVAMLMDLEEVSRGGEDNDEDSVTVAMLMDLGYSRPQVDWAVAQAHGDVQGAAEKMLDALGSVADADADTTAAFAEMHSPARSTGNQSSQYALAI